MHCSAAQEQVSNLVATDPPITKRSTLPVLASGNLANNLSQVSFGLGGLVFDQKGGTCICFCSLRFSSPGLMKRSMAGTMTLYGSTVDAAFALGTHDMTLWQAYMLRSVF